MSTVYLLLLMLRREALMFLVYVHRSGRTERALSDGCSIALISPNETSKFAALCKSFAMESFQRFPTESSYMQEEKAKKSWLKQNAESLELALDEKDSEDERVNKYKKMRTTSVQLNNLQQELNGVLSQPLKPKTFSKSYIAGSGISPLHFEKLAKQKNGDVNSSRDNKSRKLMVIGQDCVEPLQALRRAGQELMLQKMSKIFTFPVYYLACVDLKEVAGKRSKEDWKRKRRGEKALARSETKAEEKNAKEVLAI